MQRTYFKKLEHADASLLIELTEVVDQQPFNEQGLLPVITQDVTSKKVVIAYE